MKDITVMKNSRRLIALEMINSGRLRADRNGMIYCKVANKEKIKLMSITNGYYRFNTSWKSKKYNFFGHQIVWIYFNRDSVMDNLQINHKDGNKLNNSIENLELVTPKENSIHALNTGLADRYKNAGDKCGTAKLSWTQALMIKALKDTISSKNLAKMFNVSQGNISAIINDKRFKLEYCPEEYRSDEIYDFARYKVLHCDTLNKNFRDKARI